MLLPIPDAALWMGVVRDMHLIAIADDRREVPDRMRPPTDPWLQLHWLAAWSLQRSRRWYSPKSVPGEAAGRDGETAGQLLPPHPQQRAGPD